MKKVYYVGDWAVLTGPVFAETPFHHSPKGLEIFNYGVWLKDALEKDAQYQVNSVPAWDFYNNLGPGDFEQMLKDYDLKIFSDVDAKLFQLSPKFFDRSKFGKEVLTFPDRIRLTVEHAHAGGRFMFLGGWYSFTGDWVKEDGAEPVWQKYYPYVVWIMRIWLKQQKVLPWNLPMRGWLFVLIWISAGVLRSLGTIKRMC